MTWNSSHRFTLTSCVLAFEIGFSLLASGRFATAQNLFVAEDGASVGAAYIYEFKPNGTRSTFASGLYAPAALAFNSSGDLFVAGDSAVNGGPPDQGYIYEFTPNGTQSTFASGLVDGPVALAFSSSGDLFVGAGNNIYEYTPNGTQSTFASVNDVGGLAFNSSGDLFASNGVYPADIYEFTPNGTRSTFASTAGEGTPGRLAVNSSGDLFVAGNGGEDKNTGFIFEFTPNGTQSTIATGLDFPAGLAVNSSGDLFASDDISGNIYEYTPNGTQSTFASGLEFPQGLAFAPSPVPEPAAVMLLGSALLLGLGVVYLRRRGAKA